MSDLNDQEQEQKNRHEFRELRDYLATMCGEINEHSSTSGRYIKTVLTSTLVDLHSMILILEGQMPGFHINQSAFDDYVKHLKSSFLTTMFSAIEVHIRELAQKIGVVCEGRIQKIRKLSEQAIELTEDKEMLTILRKIRRGSGGTFVEFPLLLSKFLNRILPKQRAKEWQEFLHILRIMRNASHNGFRAGETGTIHSPWLSKSFEKGEGFDVPMDFLRLIPEALREFFREVDTAIGPHH